MHKITAWLRRIGQKIPTDTLYRWWKGVPKAVRVPLVLIIGSTIIATGIAMLVLPGPGWAAIFLGFAILATEFAVAEKVRDWLILQFKRAIASLKKRWQQYKNNPKA